MFSTPLDVYIGPWPYWFLREQKWCRLDSNLRMCYRIASPSGLLYLRMSKRFSLDFIKSSSIQNSNERIEASQFSMVILERKASMQIEEG